MSLLGDADWQDCIHDHSPAADLSSVGSLRRVLASIWRMSTACAGPCGQVTEKLLRKILHSLEQVNGDENSNILRSIAERGKQFAFFCYLG